jgi:2-phosphoglycerate kinase
VGTKRSQEIFAELKCEGINKVAIEELREVLIKSSKSSLSSFAKGYSIRFYLLRKILIKASSSLLYQYPL